jgi:hypothetical protein
MLHLRALGERERILDVDAQVPNCALDFRVAEQGLNGVGCPSACRRSRPWFVAANASHMARLQHLAVRPTKLPQLWLYAGNDRHYDEALIHKYYQAFVSAAGRARFELLHGVRGDDHTFRVYPDRWQTIADEFLATLDRQGR